MADGTTGELPVPMSGAAALGEALGGPGAETKDGEGNRKDNAPIKPKDFFWDQFVKYLASIMALLTLLDVTLQFFRGGGTVCIVPGTMDGQNNTTIEITRDQVAYINTYCQQSLSRAEYYPFFVLIQGIILVVPHFVWESLFVGKFEYFFSRVQQLDRLPSRETGKYREKNFEIVKQLENHFDTRLKYVNLFLLFLALCILIYGIVWCFIRHIEELGSKDVALFAFSSGLRTSDFPDVNFYHCNGNPFNPRIKKDIDFLILKLFRADSGHGFVFKDIQVERELNEIIEEEVKSIEFKKNGSPHESLVEFSKLYGQGEKQHAVDVTFGSVGYSLILARKFNNVVSVNFDPFYANEKELSHIEGFEGYHTVTFPENIYAKMGLKPDMVGIPSSVALQFITQSFKHPWKYLTLIDGKINYIIVGGILKRKQATVDLFLKQLHDERKLAENCVLSVITPCINGYFHGSGISLVHNQDQWQVMNNRHLFGHKCHTTECSFLVTSYQYRGTEVEATS